jgi:hypothetical protein
MTDCAALLAAVLLVCAILLICAFSVGLRTCQVYLRQQADGLRSRFAAISKNN